MRKYMILIAGVLMQMVLGSIYAWSEIAIRLYNQAGYSAAQTQLVYGLSIGVFALGTILTGRLLLKIGPRNLGLLSALLFLGSFFIASRFVEIPLILTAALGVGLGCAIACGYVIPLSTATRWFPDSKGTVTGFAVMGFGGGAIAASWIIHSLSAGGSEISSILLTLGILGSAVLFLGSLVQAFPEESGVTRKVAHLRVHDVVRAPLFWGLFSIMFLSTAGGLIVIGNVVEIALEMNVAVIIPVAVTLLAIGNSAGRLLWGSLLDKLGVKSIYLSLVLMTVGFLLLLFSNSVPFLFAAGILLTGLQFGASLVLYGSYTESAFGAGAITTVYPMIFASYGIAALVGPSLGGAIFDASGSYDQVLLYSTLLPILGLIIFAVARNRALKETGNLAFGGE